MKLLRCCAALHCNQDRLTGGTKLDVRGRRSPTGRTFSDLVPDDYDPAGSQGPERELHSGLHYGLTLTQQGNSAGAWTRVSIVAENVPFILQERLS